MKANGRQRESRGNIEKITSYDNATVGSGTIVNEIKHVYNDFGQLQQEFQSHSGAVDDTLPTVSPK